MSDLWEKWEEHYRRSNIDPSQICKDGIISKREFDLTKPKILFILKDVNQWAGGDLPSWLCKDGPKKQMWHTLSRWAAGLLYDFPPYEEINNRKQMREALLRVAAINLKKVSGGARASDSKINAFAFHDKHLLLEQIDHIKPNLIVSCSVFHSLIWLLELKFNPDRFWKKPVGEPVLDRRRNAWVIPWKHPGRKNNEETYRELKVMMEQVNYVKFS